DEHRYLRVLRLDALDQIDCVGAGHGDIHQEDLELAPLQLLQDLSAADCLARDGEIGRRFQYMPQAPPHDRVVIRHEYPDRFHRLLDRNGHGDAGAAPGRAGDAQLPAQHDHPLLYPEQTEGSLAACGVHVEAYPVVLDVKAYALCVVIEQDLHFAGARVPGDVGQRFLHDAEQHD